jgi:hypothetical protein
VLLGRQPPNLARSSGSRQGLAADAALRAEQLAYTKEWGRDADRADPDADGARTHRIAG